MREMMDRVLDSDAFGIFTIAWVAGWLLISFLVRRAQGKRFFAPTGDVYEFSEKWVSGRSLDTWWSRLGGARNCLFVGLAQEKLLVQPHFPFVLFFMPEIGHLEQLIPLTRITRITTGRYRLRSVLRLEYSDPDGRKRVLELGLRHPEEFLRIVHGRSSSTTELNRGR